jgi:hypothetical protein
MVELVLGALIFITVIVFGLYVGEMGYLMAKVHEAGAYAMWDSTAYQTYTYNGGAPGTGNTTMATGQAGSYASTQYQDYNGLTGTAGGAPTLIFTQAQTMNVACAPDPVPVVDPWTGVIPPLTQDMQMNGVAPDGAVSCTATGTVTPAAALPVSFLENTIGGTFHVKNYIGPALSMVCANGFPASGTCANNKMNILLGDYGLNNGNAWNDTHECYLAGTGGDNGGACSNAAGNQAFYKMTKQLWDASMQNQGFAQGWTQNPENFVCTTVGVPGCPGGGVTDFYMSFRGSESPTPFTETLLSDTTTWQTNPMDGSAYTGSPPGRYRGAYTTRKNCESHPNAAGALYPFCYLGKFECD